MSHLKTFFEGTFPPPEGFEVANQGETRRAPGEGPESTADAQEMVATDRSGEPVTITWNPGEYGADIDKLLTGMQGFETLREKLKSAGPYDSISLDFHEAEELRSCLNGFLNSRAYSKPTVQFAQDVLTQMEPGVVVETFVHPNEVDASAYEQFEKPDKETPEYISPQRMEKINLHKQLYPYIFSEVTPQMYQRYADEVGKPAKNENEVRWWMASKNYKMTEDLQKSSEKEHEEHPWMSKAQAYQVAKDHAHEGKMESVFVGKRKL